MSIKLESISYRGPSGTAVRDLSLEIATGDFVGIIGLPGSGKSALLGLMSGLVQPSGGSVLIDGRDIGRKSGKKDSGSARPVLLTRTGRNVFFEQSLERELAISLRGTGLSREERDRRVDFWLERMGFEKKRHQTSPLCLSAGERQRLAIAAVLVREPHILLLDGPFSALDGRERELVMEILKEENEKGMTVVMNTGEAQLISQYAKTIVLMEQGRIVRCDSAKSIFTDYYELKRRRLPVPAVREASQRLRERGVNMPSNVVLYEQFIDRLKIIMWRKDK